MTSEGDSGDASRLPQAAKADNPIVVRPGDGPSKWAVTLLWASVAFVVIALGLLLTTFLT